MKKRLLAAVLCVMLLLSGLSISAGAENADSPQTAADTSAQDSGRTDYYDYIQKYSEYGYPVGEVNVTAAQAVASDGAYAGEHSGIHSVIWSEDGTGSAQWQFTVKESGLYKMELEYFILNSSMRSLTLDMRLDGKFPFVTAQDIELPCHFNYDEIAEDSLGNDIRPTLKLISEWITEAPLNSDGVTTDGYSFFLSEGAHTLTLDNLNGQVAIASIRFYNDTPLQPYSPPDDFKAGNAFETVQAEDTLYVNDLMLYPISDNANIDTYPSSPDKQKLNTIGGSNWNKVGQTVSWTVNAPEDGYYYIGMRYRQNLATGLTVYRTLRVNGEIPFAEAENIPFAFSQKWQTGVLGGETPWLIKLNKGENILSLTATIGENIELQSQLKSLLSQLNTITRKIMMITSANPDSLRDYNLEKEIPELMDWLKQLGKDNITILKNTLAAGNDISGSLSCLEELDAQLKDCVSDPDVIPTYLSRLQSSYSSISSLMLGLTEQPLEIDYLVIADNTDNIEFQKNGIFKRFGFWLMRLMASYSSEYAAVGASAEGSTQINVWVNLGREQSKIVQTLSNQLFVEQNNIAVNVSLVNQSVVTAALSGSGPDVLLFVAEDDPIDLALRNAAYPLNEFEGFEEAKSNFRESSFDSYELAGNTYAIPLTDTFSMMFYRTDVFDDLGIEPPKDWEQFYEVLQILQRNKMTVGIPVDNTFYYTLIYQAGGKFYNDELSAVQLLSDEALSMFRTWTDLYKEYGLDVSYSFVNRFRSGEMPLAIENYSQYLQLEVGAPEIKGLWEMLPVPGVRNADGTINNSVSGAGTAAVIMKNTDNPEAAWKFLKWFVGTDVQAQLGNDLESLLGASGRYATANIESLGKLGWSRSELEVLVAQFDKMFKLPKVPGSYIVTRDVQNAFRKVVYHSQNPRDTLIQYSETINAEIERKRNEFGLE